MGTINRKELEDELIQGITEIKDVVEEKDLYKKAFKEVLDKLNRIEQVIDTEESLVASYKKIETIIKEEKSLKEYETIIEAIERMDD